MDELRAKRSGFELVVDYHRSPNRDSLGKAGGAGAGAGDDGSAKIGVIDGCFFEAPAH